MTRVLLALVGFLVCASVISVEIWGWCWLLFVADPATTSAWWFFGLAYGLMPTFLAVDGLMDICRYLRECAQKLNA